MFNSNPVYKNDITFIEILSFPECVTSFMYVPISDYNDHAVLTASVCPKSSFAKLYRYFSGIHSKIIVRKKLFLNTHLLRSDYRFGINPIKKFVLRKTKLVLNSRTVHYLDLD